MRSVMLNGISLARDARADYTIGVQVLGGHAHEGSRHAGVRREVVARVVAAVAGSLGLGALVDQHLLGPSELRGAVPASERLREAPHLAAAGFLLLGGDRIAERVGARARTWREAERVHFGDARVAHELQSALEGALVLGWI